MCCILASIAERGASVPDSRKWEKKWRDGGPAIHETRRKIKGDVGAEVVREKEEGEKLVNIFGAIYEFFNPVTVVPVVPVNDFVLVALLARFVPDVALISFHHCMTTSSSA